MKTGMFITFEGLDGSGKSTQCHLLAEQLKCASLVPVMTCEPGGTHIGSAIRKILLDKQIPSKPAHLTEALLFAADRAQHVIEIIVPALEANKIVICDRYIDSTLAYQGYGRQYELDLIKQLIKIATNNLKPDLTFLLDIPPTVIQERLNNQDRNKLPDRLDCEKLEFHQRVRQGYLSLSEAEPNRFRVIDALNFPDEIHKSIWQQILLHSKFAQIKPSQEL